jgi:hypothetical protein
MRDAIRRMLGKVPLIALTSNPADAGKPSGAYRAPTNDMINFALDIATKEIARKAKFKVNSFVSVPIPAGISQDQPYGIPLNGIITNTPGFVQDLRRVVWQDNLGGAPMVLTFEPRETFDRNLLPLNQGGFPEYCWVDSYTLYLYGPPQSAGTLYCVAGVAPAGFLADNDTLQNDDVPVLYQDSWLFWSAAYLAATQIADAEMQGLAQVYGPKAVEEINAFLQWASAGKAPETQYSIGQLSYRVGQGCRSIRN